MALLSNFDILIAAIDIRTAIRENDIELAKSVVETVNSIELTNDYISVIDDATQVTNIIECDKFDACIYILTNMKELESRIYKLTIAEMYQKFRLGTRDEVANWVRDKYRNVLEMSSEKDLYFIAKSMITICANCRRFDIMEEVRSKLEEVRAKLEEGEY